MQVPICVSVEPVFTAVLPRPCPHPVHPSVGMASLRERVKAGALPKARRPLAIFFVDFIEKGKASGNDPDMQAAAAAWKELGEQGQQSWKELSKKEFVQQQRAATSLGIVYGNSAAVRAERKKSADTVRNSPAKCRRGNTPAACPPVAAAAAPGNIAAMACPGPVPTLAAVERDDSAFLGPFRVLPGRSLGSGGYGVILPVEHTISGRPYAANVFFHPEGLDNCKSELAVYQALSHKPSEHMLEVTASYLSEGMSWLILPGCMLGHCTGMLHASLPCSSPSCGSWPGTCALL